MKADIVNIHIEGHDGTGKTTQVEMLRNALRKLNEKGTFGKDVVVNSVKFPREYPPEPVEKNALGALYYLNDMAHWIKQQRHLFNQTGLKRINVLDRSYLSTAIYQETPEAVDFGHAMFSKLKGDLDICNMGILLSSNPNDVQKILKRIHRREDSNDELDNMDEFLLQNRIVGLTYLYQDHRNLVPMHFPTVRISNELMDEREMHSSQFIHDTVLNEVLKYIEKYNRGLV